MGRQGIPGVQGPRGPEGPRGQKGDKGKFSFRSDYVYQMHFFFVQAAFIFYTNARRLITYRLVSSTQKLHLRCFWVKNSFKTPFHGQLQCHVCLTTNQNQEGVGHTIANLSAKRGETAAGCHRQPSYLGSNTEVLVIIPQINSDDVY